MYCRCLWRVKTSQVAVTPRLRNVGVKQSLVEVLNNVAYRYYVRTRSRRAGLRGYVSAHLFVGFATTLLWSVETLNNLTNPQSVNNLSIRCARTLNGVLRRHRSMLP